MAGQIFNGNINATATAWMMIFMLIFCCTWEAFCGKVERALEHNRAHMEMLGKVGRELMILGFIAFAIILSKELEILIWNAKTLHCFEFCDLLVSITVLIYVANCAIASMTMTAIQRHWDRTAMTQTSVIIQRAQRHLDAVESGSCVARLLYWLPLVGQGWRRDADFKVLQLLFEMKFHLPVSFDYVVYIKRVLESVVVTMANIKTGHWALIMLINAVWWLAIEFGLPIFGKEGMSDKNICMITPADECDANRRRLGAAAVSTDGSGSGYDDISAKDTKVYLIIYVVIGWVVCLLQAWIVITIEKKTHWVSEFNGAAKTQDVVKLLEDLQKKLVDHEKARDEDTLENDDDEGTTVSESKKMHAPWASTHSLIVGEEHADDHEERMAADHFMVFKDAGKTSNDILSVKQFDFLVFMTQFYMLVCDFYLAFYVVHMRKRIPKAYDHEGMGDGHAMQQVLFHAFILIPIALTFYLLMLTARKIALLFGVLHLNEDAVSDVLEHMETVKSIRRRIQDTLGATKIVRSSPNPSLAQAKLDKAQQGEVAMLKLLAAKPSNDRITTTEMKSMITAHASNLTMAANDLEDFMDRDSFKAFKLLDPRHQETHQTAKTLETDPTKGADPSGDSILVREFSGFILRYVCDIMDQAIALSTDTSAVRSFSNTVKELESVDPEVFEFSKRLTRAKELFKMTDTDKSGEISRHELYTALRRYKVPINQKDFRTLFRVIDPDQTRSLQFAEWIDFMMATDGGMDLHTSNAHTAVPDMKRGEKVWPEGATDTSAGAAPKAEP